MAPKKKSPVAKPKSKRAAGKSSRVHPVRKSRTTLSPDVRPYVYEPLTDAVQEAEHRKHVMQTEAAINIGIGLVVHRGNQRAVKITRKEIEEFVRKHTVQVTECEGEEAYILTVVDR